MARLARWRTRRAATGLLGGLLTLSGMVVLCGAAIEAGQASADTAPFELFCTGTPIGNLAFNDVVVRGTLSPAAPSAGQQFSITGFQAQTTVPADIVQQAAIVGNTSLSGTATATIGATGATPATMSTGAMAYDFPLPNPVPSSGVQLDVPTTPATIGPFTATSSDVAVTLASAIKLTFTDVALPILTPFVCSAYPNDVVPSGQAAQLPPGLPLTPVIAYAGTPPPPPPANAPTGPYELYCPGTPVGDLDFNDVTTSASLSSSTLAAGDTFQVTGYQISIPVPTGAVSAAAGLSNSRFAGLATSNVDAYGASPMQVPTGSLGFDVPIPDPVPLPGVTVAMPTSPTSVGSFTALGGPLTIAQDQQVLVVAELSGKGFKMSCTAYPNDSLPTSGSTTTAPPGAPFRPIVAVADVSGTPIPPPTTGPPSHTPTGPYEMYCRGTPIGDIAVNDVVTSATITPSTLNEGDSFQLSGLQTQFTIPQAIAQQAEDLGLTSLSGTLSLFLDVTGSQYPYPYPIYYGGGGVGVPTTAPGIGPTTTVTAIASSSGSSSGSSGSSIPVVVVPPSYPVPGFADLSFDVTLPSPVPAGGVQFTATPTGQQKMPSFVAAGGPIQVLVGGADLSVSAFGDRFGLFCNPLANDSVPTGLATNEPYRDIVEPLVTTGSATVVPPPPSPPGAYELYCPGTPVGNIALNNVQSSGTIPQTLTAGQTFDLTGYQASVPLPSSIVSAAAALGNTAITGSATATLDATGATPASLQTGTMDFDVPIPSPVPSSGVTFSVPSSPVDVGPFTATGTAVTISQAPTVSLTLTVAGNSLDLTCTSYPNYSVPTGITGYRPQFAPVSPTVATSGVPVPPPPTPGSPGPYELFCPGTPVGDIALNDVTTSGSITPASPAVGDQFNVTGYQTEVTIPSAIASAAAALGNTTIAGTADVTVDVSGATPASVATPVSFSLPIPASIPPTGLTLAIPSTPITVGPFTATSTDITVTEDSHAQLSLEISNATLSLSCIAYANDSSQGGIVPTAPSGVAPVTPTIAATAADTGSTTTTTTTATTSSTTTSTTTTTTDPGSTTSTSTTAPGGSTTTTSSPQATSTTASGSSSTQAPATQGGGGSIVTASSGSLAFTGPGSGLRMAAGTGAALLLVGLLLLVAVDAPRRSLRRLLASPRASGTAAARAASGGGRWLIGR